MVLGLPFKGLVIPAFTPFNSRFELNLKEIPKYARYLKNCDVKTILVNGTAGEGALMTVEERKQVTEAWVEVSKSTGQNIMVQVGGTHLKGVTELAKHAENLRVSSILCLPDLFIRPSSSADLIHYLSYVSQAAPNTPLLYYHNPSTYGVSVNLKDFLQKVYHEIPSFAGLKYAGDDLKEAFELTFVHDGVFSVYCSNTYIVPGAVSLGFEHYMVTVSNLAPKLYEKLIQPSENLSDANEKSSLNRKFCQIMSTVTKEVNAVTALKSLTSEVANLQLGSTRPPTKLLTEEQFEEFKTELNKLINP